MGNSRPPMTDDELSTLLRALDRAPPDLRADEIIIRARRRHTRRSTLIAAAAFVAVATVAAAAVPGFPLHEYIRHAVGSRAPKAANVAAPAQAPAPTASVSRGISFVPDRHSRIAFAAEQSLGSLRVHVIDGPSLRITQTSSDREAQFTLTPDGASVHNAGSTASYEILLPDRISDAVVLIAGKSVYSRIGIHSSCSGTRDSEQGCVISMHRQKSSSIPEARSP
ncbi:MAG: hypothetical protein JWO39_940 [Gemmatimonadetes bacterium]|nr:hypothetical protein [Gemmatimonadota bacterium]